MIEKNVGEFWRLRLFGTGCRQGCQMIYFQTRNPNLGKFWRFLQWKMLVYFMDIWSIYGRLIYFIAIWHSSWPFCKFFPRYVVCCIKKNLATLVAEDFENVLLNVCLRVCRDNIVARGCKEICTLKKD
jgi:hypothetical protein